MSRQVSDNLGKLESMVEKRVKVVLGSVGVPSSADIDKLSTELKKLSQQVSGLEKQLKAKAKAAPKTKAKAKAKTKAKAKAKAKAE